MSLSEACDDLLSSGILHHEYGIPVLWPRTAPLVQKPDLETEYYHLNRDLATAVNRLVYLNRIDQLHQMDPQKVDEAFSDAFSAGPFKDMSFEEKERHLHGLTRFKTDTLTTDFLSMALPVLRSIYQENSALTDAEFTILNNLKKLYSHYNQHPANIRRLLDEYNTQTSKVLQEAALHAEIDTFLKTELVPNLSELESLNNDYLALQNTYDNKVTARESPSSDTVVKKLKQASLTCSRRLLRLSALCDLLPNLILCQASNWHSDKALLDVMNDCQDLAEKLEYVPDIFALSSRSVDEILKADLGDLAL
ncbi:hypothetical protein JCM33374_g1703 [Metschnikowia sp. JCM 33374]|nr:hypothetical protein JCM33374_g1703 [Metschnikowia sp. JCM 33374]